MYAAIEVSQYIIGSGSCAVSQFMALNIGARHRVGRSDKYLLATLLMYVTPLFLRPTEPGLVALWEEDLIIKECRLLLHQRMSLHKPCNASSYLERSSSKPLFQTFLDGQWNDKTCLQFLPPLPNCFGDAG